MRTGVLSHLASSGQLADDLREATHSLHARAERAGVMQSLLARRLPLHGYVRMLRNLHAIYVALEAGLTAQGSQAHATVTHDDALNRSASLESDLFFLHGPGWETTLGIEPATREYVTRLRHFARDRPLMLVSHAYVRYLGDLNGGQVLQRIVRETFDLGGVQGTQFYRFECANVRLRAVQFKASLDRIETDLADRSALAEEARWAFRQHILLFDELAAQHDQSPLRR